VPTTFVLGDIFATPLDGIPALAHGCNCRGKMGKGIAVAFREMYPRMYLAYAALCREQRPSPGEVMAWTEEEDGPIVYNLFTQDHWKDGATWSAVETSVRSMIRHMEANDVPMVLLPRVGAGLGRLSWSEVRHLLKILGDETDRRLVVVETYRQHIPVTLPLWE